MSHPIFPNNITEIPHITFSVIKKECSNNKTIAHELSAIPQKDRILKGNSPLLNYLSGELLFKELGVDYCA